jgi:hypothetical protein
MHQSPEERFDPVFAAFQQQAVDPPAETREALEAVCLGVGRAGFHALLGDAAWTERMEEAVRSYFREELTEEVLETHEDGAQAWARFASYAVGWLIALQVSGQLAEEDVDIAFALLPGYMWQYEARICARTGA